MSLVQLDLAPAWMVAVILGRDFAVTVLRSLAYSRGVAIPASPLGKIKMVAQVVAILALILARGQWNDVFAGSDRRAALWVAVLTVADIGSRLLPPLQRRAQSARDDFSGGEQRTRHRPESRLSYLRTPRNRR